MYCSYFQLCGIEEMKNCIFSNVVASGDEVKFYVADELRFVMNHSQDCCEHVYVESIDGDLLDLIRSPILEAEKVSSGDPPPASEYTESHTWTFYKLGTTKGFVTIRWYGESNGYYSESVDIYDLKKGV